MRSFKLTSAKRQALRDGALEFGPRRGRLFERRVVKSATVQLALLVGIFHLQGADPDFVPAPNSPLKLAGGGHNFILGDVNGDRKPDLLVCGGASLTVLFGNGRGGFEPTA